MKEPCVMYCDFIVEGNRDGHCLETLEGEFVLQAGGGFVVNFPKSVDAVAKGWDALPGPAGAVVCRCPKHPFTQAEREPKKIIGVKAEVGPAGLPINGNGRMRS